MPSSTLHTTSSADQLYAPPVSDSQQQNKLMSELVAITNYWKKRRIQYNLTLLIVGIICIVLFSFNNLGGFLTIIPFAIAYGIGANLMFSLGPYINLLGVIQYNRPAKPWRIVFILGYVFSILTTIAPLLLITIIKNIPILP